MALSPLSTNRPELAALTTAYAVQSLSLPATLNDHELRPSVRAVPADCHSFRRAVLPLLRRRGTLCSLLGASRTYSVQAYGWNRSPAQPLAHQVRVKLRSDALHLYRLSSSVFLVGFDANGKELTRGSQPLSPRGKIYD